MDEIINFFSGTPAQWVVERLDIDGEELPIIRHASTWLPAPVALRYMLRTRFAVGPAQLTTDMRAIALLYNWSKNVAGVGSFEAFLTAGKFLSREHLRLLSRELQWRRRTIGAGPTEQQTDCLVAAQTYNVRLFAVRQFLRWAYEPENHGGIAGLNQDEINTRIRD